MLIVIMILVLLLWATSVALIWRSRFYLGFEAGVKEEAEKRVSAERQKELEEKLRDAEEKLKGVASKKSSKTTP